MISDKLYGLAFEFKKTRLWRVLEDPEMFAVRLTGGRLGYISIMGGREGHFALGLYIGEQGLNSFRSMMKADEMHRNLFQFQEEVLKQECLKCAFEGKDGLTEEEREETREYARNHGIRISGRNAYPHFLKYYPGCYPWYIQSGQEQEDLCEALAAGIEVARLLEGKAPVELGFCDVWDGEIEIPLLEQKDGVYALSKVKLPAWTPEPLPAPAGCNEIGIASLKKVRKSGVWECEIVQYPEPVQDSSEEVPFFPYVLMAIEVERDYILPVDPVRNYMEAPEELLNLFIDALLREGLCPKKMKVRDERTYHFAKEFCAKLKIPISIEQDLPVLDQVEYDFLRHFSMSEEEEIGEMLDMITEIMAEEGMELESLPAELLGQLEMVLQQGALPAGLEQKVEGLLHPNQGRLTKSDFKTVKVKKNQSYVISVSLGTGCYRHIQIAGGSTLWGLHSAILDAFGFDDDHAHAFFMDNVRWSERDCYYMDGMEEGGRATGAYSLDQAGLCKGKQFKYLFDFGDEWLFQCKVLRVVDGDTELPVVLKAKGDAPEQYPMWEDE